MERYDQQADPCPEIVARTAGSRCVKLLHKDCLNAVPEGQLFALAYRRSIACRTCSARTAAAISAATCERPGAVTAPYLAFQGVQASRPGRIGVPALGEPSRGSGAAEGRSVGYGADQLGRGLPLESGRELSVWCAYTDENDSRLICQKPSRLLALKDFRQIRRPTVLPVWPPS